MCQLSDCETSAVSKFSEATKTFLHLEQLKKYFFIQADSYIEGI